MEKAPVAKERKIGMAFLCCDWEKWCSHSKHCGVLIGIYGTKLYYFEEAKKINLNRLELVSFIEDEENPNVAKHVLRLEQRKVESEENKRFDKISWANKYVTNLFFESREYENISELTDFELKTEIARLRKYIEELDGVSAIKTFAVRNTGYYVRRVGKDDHFHYSRTRSVDCDDLFINHLLQTGEDSGYECTNSYEEDYDYIDESETQSGIKNALSQYDKESHLAFLLNKYIKERNEKLFRKAEIQQVIEGLFNVDMVWNAIGRKYWNEFEYEEVVTEYNMRNSGWD